MPTTDLDQELLALRAAIESLVDRSRRLRADEDGDEQVERDRDQHDQRQCLGIEKEHGDEDDANSRSIADDRPAR